MRHLAYLAICSAMLVMNALGAESALARINAALEKDWKNQKLTPVPSSSDEVFLRRAWLDIAGRIPPVNEIKNFLADRDPDKRRKLIDRLLLSDGYADMMAMRYADMLRVKSEFPINLWPNAVQLYFRYLRDSAARNLPYNVMARALLTASGSNFRVPESNFFRATADRSPLGLAKVAALTFLNLRLEKMPENVQLDMAAFFSRIRYKSTAEWKEELVYTDPLPEHLTAATPDGMVFHINSPETDPRQVFADWLLQDRDLAFSKAFVNRAWYWVFGRGLIEPADDMAPPVCSNWWRKLSFCSGGGQFAEPVNPELLEILAAEFKNSNYDVRHLFRLIYNCASYQADWKTRPDEIAAATAHFAVYPARRLESELIIDLIGDLTGRREQYTSVIPEPFTIMPPTTRAIWISDGSISSTMLDSFGRPPRDSGLFSERNNRINGSQRLFLMNSSKIYSGLQNIYRNRLRKDKALRNPKKLIERCYLMTLSRPPTQQEIATVMAYADNNFSGSRQGQIAIDLLWALVNSKEFLYHH